MTRSVAHIAQADLADSLRQAVSGAVRFDATSRLLYSTDASNYQIEPLGVVIPRDAADVAAAVSVCAQAGVPVLARGAGSSLSGQAIGRAVILDCSTHLNQIEAVDVEARWVRVQPGVVINTLNAYLRPFGLFDGVLADRLRRCGSSRMVPRDDTGLKTFFEDSKHGSSLGNVISESVI